MKKRNYLRVRDHFRKLHAQIAEAQYQQYCAQVDADEAKTNQQWEKADARIAALGAKVETLLEATYALL